MNKEFSSRLEQIETILSKNLPNSTNSEWQKNTFGILDDCVNNSHIENLITPCATLVSLGGKRWRPLLLVLCAEMTKEAKKSPSKIETAYNLTPLVEFAHTASLIHDDIEDAADTRRGKPAAHITYGLDVALNAASWLYFQASSCIKNLDVPDSEKLQLYELFLEELRRLHLGQAMDIKWHRNPEMIPTVNEYTAMVRNKTGTLSRLAVKIGIFAGGGTLEETEKAGKYAEDIGTGFQILDDVTNLTTGNPGKKRGDDIVEGKKSLPVLYHLESNPEDKEKLAQLFEQARKEGIDSAAVEKAITLLESSNSIQRAKEMGKKILCENVEKLASIFSDAESLLIKELFSSMQKK